MFKNHKCLHMHLMALIAHSLWILSLSGRALPPVPCSVICCDELDSDLQAANIWLDEEDIKESTFESEDCTEDGPTSELGSESESSDLVASDVSSESENGSKYQLECHQCPASKHP